MSYQVLARKWRPKRFQEMVGQEHVLKALVNALDDDRLHHAYLFTGTRGVGKTSIARLFAKSLNCETGVSSSPCGECSACREIAEGRFVDLIEVDAASRTKVEDTRELLENVQYAPTHGRYKVYLIDEVHMLSTHSFNALLKTLEEPPPHVKFLLATTDPQKLPVTILSRCLQFNLKNMIPERIVDHLKFVLGEENVSYEEPALWLLARSADGSMRDAMSLTDQAIAFGAGVISEADARAMLGTIDTRLVYQMIDCLVAQDAQALLEAVKDLAQYSPDYNTVLGDLISVLHRIAVGQAVPAAVDNSLGDKERIQALAAQLRAEDLQLYYQVALMGRKDLPFVPDPREGLEMILLRMLAFRPAGAQASGRPPVAAPAADVSAVPEAPQTNAPVAANPSAPVQPPSQPPAQASDAVPAVAPAESTIAAPPAPQSEPPSAPETAAAPVVKAEPQRSEPAAPQAAAPAMANPGVTEASAPVPPPHMQNDVPPWEDADIPPPSYTDGEPAGMTAPSQVVEAPPVSAPAERAAPAKKPEPNPAAALLSAVSEDSRVAPANVQAQAPVNANVPEVKAPVRRSVAAAVPASDLADLPKQLSDVELDHWVRLATVIGLTGMTASLANNLSLEQVEDSTLCFHYTPEQKTLLTDVQRERISSALNHYFDTSVAVEFKQDMQTRETPDQYMVRKREERLQLAIETMRSDETVLRLQEHFDARLDEASVEPID